MVSRTLPCGVGSCFAAAGYLQNAASTCAVISSGVYEGFASFVLVLVGFPTIFVDFDGVQK